MIDIDEYIEMWNDHLLSSQGCADLTNALIAEVKRMQEDTLKVVSQWFEWYGGEENEWRKLELALGLPLTPLSWEGQE